MQFDRETIMKHEENLITILLNRNITVRPVLGGPHIEWTPSILSGQQLEAQNVPPIERSLHCGDTY